MKIASNKNKIIWILFSRKSKIFSFSCVFLFVSLMCWFSACTIITQIEEKQRTIGLSGRVLLVSRKTTSNTKQASKSQLGWNQWYLHDMVITLINIWRRGGQVDMASPDIAMPINHINLSQPFHICMIYLHSYDSFYCNEFVHFAKQIFRKRVEAVGKAASWIIQTVSLQPASTSSIDRIWKSETYPATLFQTELYLSSFFIC